MKKTSIFLVGIALMVGMISCNKNLTALDASYFITTPSPLVEKAGKVDFTIAGTFPEKYFDKKTTVAITPILRFGNEEIKGKTNYFQGEKVKGNNPSIAYKAGGNYTLSDSFFYLDDMAKSALYLSFKVDRKGKTYNLSDVKVADGVVGTSTLFSTDVDELKPAFTADAFQRVQQETQKADILFLIQQAQLRRSETKKADITAFTQKVKEANEAENKNINSLKVSGYASPDGNTALNTALAEKREKKTVAFLDKALKKLKSSVTIDAEFTAEDWEGFQELMENSNIKDKDIILRVLTMYKDPEQREREIKNLSVAYTTIADDILPQLRRSKLQLTVDVIGKSDEEINALAIENPSELSVEELLYAVTITEEEATKEKIYRNAMKYYPKDVRAYNNLGSLFYAKGSIDKAKKMYQKALSLQPTDADTNYNLGLISLAEGNTVAAQEAFGRSVGTSGALQSALAAIYVKEGDYAKAATALKGTNTNNTALVQVLTRDYAAARKTVEKIAKPNGTTAYIGAIIAARTNDRKALYQNLKSAISYDRSLAKKALTDLEFAKYFNDTNFLKIVAP